MPISLFIRACKSFCGIVLFSETALTVFSICFESYPRDNFRGSFLNVSWLPSSLKVHLTKTLFILPLLLAKSGRLNAFYLDTGCDGLTYKKLFSLDVLAIIGEVCECFNYRRTDSQPHPFHFTNKSRSQYFSSGRDLVNF